MRITTLSLAAILLAAADPLASAQTTTNITTPAKTTAQPAAISDTDRGYLAMAAQASAYELAIASAAQKSNRADVRAYAESLVRDHTAYNQALTALARSKGVTLPDGMTASDQAKVAAMAQGTMGNGAFIEEAVRINAEGKRTTAEEAAHTQDADIEAHLKKFRAMDAEHERMALALSK